MAHRLLLLVVVIALASSLESPVRTAQRPEGPLIRQYDLLARDGSGRTVPLPITVDAGGLSFSPAEWWAARVEPAGAGLGTATVPAAEATSTVASGTFAANGTYSITTGNAYQVQVSAPQSEAGPTELTFVSPLGARAFTNAPTAGGRIDMGRWRELGEQVRPWAELEGQDGLLHFQPKVTGSGPGFALGITYGREPIVRCQWAPPAGTVPPPPFVPTVSPRDVRLPCLSLAYSSAQSLGRIRLGSLAGLGLSSEKTRPARPSSGGGGRSASVEPAAARVESFLDDLDSFEDDLEATLPTGIDARRRCDERAFQAAYSHAFVLARLFDTLAQSAASAAGLGPAIARLRSAVGVVVLSFVAMATSPCPDGTATGSARPPGATFRKSEQVIGDLGEPLKQVRIVEIEPDGTDDVREVEDGEIVKRHATYLVTAACHAPVLVSGRRLLAGERASLVSSGRRFSFEPCASDTEAIARAAAELAKEGITLNRNDFDYAVKRDGRACVVSLRPRRPVATQVAPGCGDTPLVDDKGRFRGVTPANDDPSVDTNPPPPVSQQTPVNEADVKDHAARPQRGGGPAPAPDPHRSQMGSWGQAFADQWGLHRIGLGPGGFRMPAAGHRTVVAIIDTGIDRTHPDLAGALWVNDDEVAGNGVDDDGNGFVDDRHGWNFADRNGDVTDRNGHGTMVAGLIAAGVDNGVGIAGVNPWARIMAVKVGDWLGESWRLDVAAAIRYAADNGARVINVSIEGRALSRATALAVAHARTKGAVIVVAAGNDGIDVAEVTPAGLPGVVTVGAIGPDGARPAFSNWGGGVDLAAPGVDILSLRARHADPLKFWRTSYAPGSAVVGRSRDGYVMTGTSFASPYVAGVASLLFSLKPGLSGLEATRMLLHSATDVDVPGWDQYTGYGLVNAGAALAADPAHYVLARIEDATATRGRDGTVVEVTGRARADRLRRAWIEVGAGASPDQWTRVGSELTRPVDLGVVATIPGRMLQGSKEWTIRLVVEHANGSRREARFRLTVG